MTGAAHGIGLEVCRALALEGMIVLLTARDLAKATAAAEELAGEGDVRPLALDVVSDESVAAAAAAVSVDPGRLDVLVNNAARHADWEETASDADLAVAREVMDVNLFGPRRTSNALLPLVRQGAPGRIVNVTSGGGSHADPDFASGPTRGGRRRTACPRRPQRPHDLLRLGARGV
ncbi:MAG TPA: SDR family NAD(P)-dependent oxidoreductase, partial [Miltoncostaeaceae bacterium]|nr:SDR family NAD(P)-dependent oxidoreductase [Miltoncostaeaceae bacterium]